MVMNHFLVKGVAVLVLISACAMSTIADWRVPRMEPVFYEHDGRSRLSHEKLKNGLCVTFFSSTSTVALSTSTVPPGLSTRKN